MCTLGSGFPTDIYPATTHTLCIFRSSIASFFLFPLDLAQERYNKKVSIKSIALSSSSPLPLLAPTLAFPETQCTTQVFFQMLYKIAVVPGNLLEKSNLGSNMTNFIRKNNF